eukprot:jgi/Bigna1/129927/aug1.10_g4635
MTTIQHCKTNKCKEPIKREFLENIHICRHLAFPHGYTKTLRNGEIVARKPRDGFVNFAKGTVDAANEVLVARDAVGNMTGILTFNDHTTMTTLDGEPKPIAKKNEIYLDLVCGQKGTKAGTALINYFHARAENDDVLKQTRLYAAEGSDKYWSRMGYVPCEDACKKQTRKNCYERRYKLDPNAGIRMTRCAK